ncbi:hypothetical protein CS0771_32010 [Catellatospora sp. IY07-71]|uniref:histidine kinase n=1 Tax=Catellatospora sp. IY07-71 TaxID=2728827 RepID=UPI001BB3E769|nr:histidine kinase dimerization/phosphoacceptor domain-containing protein [Catellatospora sp. IY07-71]BCJ73657.1 hypothetical protein CS0771_32010 [Catellatospora sp. IY07-71]
MVCHYPRQARRERTLGLARRYRIHARTREHDQVRLVERAQLARDLHDTVAHHVSAIAIRAQAGLAAAPARPEAATDALRLIEAEASRVLAEMRAMVRVLREEPAAYDSTSPPAPSTGLRTPLAVMMIDRVYAGW